MKAVWTATQRVGVCTQQPPTPLSPLIQRRDPPMLFPASSSPYFAASSRNRGGRGRVIESNQQTTVPLRLLPPRLFSQAFFCFPRRGNCGMHFFCVQHPSAADTKIRHPTTTTVHFLFPGTRLQLHPSGCRELRPAARVFPGVRRAVAATHTHTNFYLPLPHLPTMRLWGGGAGCRHTANNAASFLNTLYNIVSR